MIVRIAWGRVREGQWDEYEALYEEVVLPTVGAVPGLLERKLLRRRDEPDEGISISYWETEQALNDYLASDRYRGTVDRLQAPFKDEWWSQTHEVRLQAKS